MILVPSALVPLVCALLPSLRVPADLTWFIGIDLGDGIHACLMRRKPAFAARAT